MSITSEAKQEVVRLLALNKKIEAVKYLKETFQVALLDAKNLVEAIEQELASGRISIDLSSIKPTVASPPAELSHEARLEVERLLLSNKKIEAVKFVHNNYKIGLKNALTWVEKVEQTIPSSMRSSTTTRRSKRSSERIFPRVFGGVALILVVVIFFLYRSNQEITSQNIYVKAQVVALESNDGDGFAPIIEYEWEGKSYRYIPTTRTNPSAYNVGEALGIYIDRKNPSEPLIDSFTDRWLGITIVGGIAFLFAFFAFVIAKLLRRF